MRKSDSRSCVKAALQSDALIIVIKIGTSSLINEPHGTLHLSNLARICEVIKGLHQQGHYVILVTSGAIGVGCQRLGLGARPAKIAQKQALAAVGQVHLMRTYTDMFSALGLVCAQVLLTLDNLANRDQYINARNTFTELLAYGAIPVVNENDTVAVQELRFGDNDTLSAQVATLVEADYLFLLTDVDALYTANPKLDPTATPIREVEDIGALTADTSTAGTQWGTGGMVTKLTAARIATAAGTTLVITSSASPEAIPDILGGAAQGTRFKPLSSRLRGRKRWLLTVPLRGKLLLDAGAERALRTKHTSLFAAGVVGCEGEWGPQDAVSICDAAGAEFGRGLCNLSSEEMAKVKGLRAVSFQEALGYHTSDEVVHRENLALLLGQGEEGHHEDDWPRVAMRDKLARRLDDAAAAAATAAGPQGGPSEGGGLPTISSPTATTAAGGSSS